MLQNKLRPTLLGILTFTALAFQPMAKAGLTVESGWDLLVTVPSGTEFMGQNWQGVPIGSYDFGGSIGYQNVQIADTIIQRPQAATVSAYGENTTVPISIAALQMMSVSAFDPDGSGPAPLDHYYITLGGPSSGTVTIDFDHEPGSPPHGWFTTDFDVYYAMHMGSLSGPVVASGVEGFELTSAFWSHDKISPGGGVPLIEGVNYELNGVDTSADFHLAYDPNALPGQPGSPTSPDCNSPWYQHLVKMGYDPAKHGVTECPEPGVNALLFLAGGLLGFARFCRRTR